MSVCFPGWASHDNRQQTVFDSDNTSIQNILVDFNNLHHKLQFTDELEHDHALNNLHITVTKTPTDYKTAIYRKPTFTDTIIPFTSNHPAHHKYAAICFLFKRLNSYNLQQKEKEQELNIIHNILHNNSYPLKPHNPPQNKPITTQNPPKNGQN
jgi:hypothetical protein